jgi:hypothetical protein
MIATRSICTRGRRGAGRWQSLERPSDEPCGDAGEPGLLAAAGCHNHMTTARRAMLLILGSSPTVEGIPACFAVGKYGVGVISGVRPSHRDKAHPFGAT